MTAAPIPSATFVVCEDGHEYVERFTRLFGATFRFVRAGHFAEALAAASSSSADVAGILLDLDFKRAAADTLIDEAGETGAARPDSERRRLGAMQGILILRALRAAAVRRPALLFADLDDAGQVAFLESSLAPLTVFSSSTSAKELARALERLARADHASDGAPPDR